MKKTLLIAAAALAAGIISSQAQVYSQNIVGYVNVNLVNGFNNVANPLDAAGGNSITNVIPGILAGTYDGGSIYIWNGTSYTVYSIDSTLGGIADAGDNFGVTPPTIAPGQGFFWSGGANTLTFVGTVHVDGAGATTNVVGLNTNTFSSGFNLVASKTAVGGGLGSNLQFPAASGALDGGSIYVPLIIGGAFSGFTVYSIDSSLGGFADAGDNISVPEPQIPVGSGFFYFGAAYPWTQSF